MILIRHPATDLAGTFCGHSDPDLNATGQAQLHALQRKLAQTSLDRLLSSDLLRTRRCAQALAEQHGIEAIFTPALREMHFGDWEGLRWEEIQVRFPEQAQRWLQGFATFTPPHAEAYGHFTTRISREATEWLQDVTDTTLAIVTHRGVLVFLLQQYCGIEATAAWELSSHYATVLFCARAAGGDHPWTVRETWHPE
ncbi:MAG: histidine phosphatase family protein [Steroidobacteraceae bacterium]